ncbi:F-box/FBD/LRR-repeat protein At5g56420-like [Papaver somniferum]|uniref:F-box/FBD/LRR-repeat protein At5g56420-like n=1 Tax=Papaver somniferum TaxID=3469 RepID=UPI000E6F77D9|nr:F-box/FBD/LRR-repeat protein At5g56420-like [Papaver somniferum]
MANKTRKIITLPDDVLVRILSLVPTEQAFLTSLLSKRWKFLWTSIPVLDFDYGRFSETFDDIALDDDDQKRRFLDFVQHVLFLHELEPLENLRLAFEISKFDDYISKVSMGFTSSSIFFFRVKCPESNLKCLVLQSCHGNDSLAFEHAFIHIPTLFQLKYQGVFTSSHLSISSSKNLIEVEVDISCSLTLHNQHQLTCKLLKDLQNVKSLALFSHNLEVLNMNGGIRLPTPFNNLKHLIVKLAKVDKELLGFVCLPRSSPYLETLALSIDFNYLVPKNEMLSAVYIMWTKKQSSKYIYFLLSV